MSSLYLIDAKGRRLPACDAATGTATKAPKGARWRARWRTPEGKSRTGTFARKLEAQKHLDAVSHSKYTGSYIDTAAGRETVETYAIRWSSAQSWRPSSRDRVAHVLRAQVVPRFGARKLHDLRRSDVEAWVGSMTEEGLASSTVESYFRVLAAVMRSARRDRLVHESPCDGVRLPRSDRAPSALVPLTSEQVGAISTAVPEHYRALVLACAGLGLRQGEACGLTVDRVDFLRRRVTVDRQLVTPAGVGPAVLGPVKTASSNRVLTLPETVGEHLAAHLARFGVGDRGFVFTSTTGAPLRRSTWSDTFRSATRSLGIDASTHDLRHHSASMLISAGCSVTAVQHFLGHKNASETLDTYSHLWPNDEVRIRAAVDAGLRTAAATITEGAIS